MNGKLLIHLVNGGILCNDGIKLLEVNYSSKYHLFLMAALSIKIDDTSAVYTFTNEGHTLGNILSRQLEKHPGVMFSAYEVPHPLDNKMEVTFMTEEEDPKQAMRLAVMPVIDLLDNLEKKLKTALKKKK